MTNIFKNLKTCVTVVDRNGSKFIFDPDEVKEIIEHKTVSGSGGLFNFTYTTSSQALPVSNIHITTSLYMGMQMLVLDLTLDEVVDQVKKQMIHRNVEKGLDDTLD